MTAATPSLTRETATRETTELGRAGVLAWAAANDATVRLFYRKADAESVEIRTITPIAVRQSSGGGRYVVAFDQVRHARRTFLLSRIEGVVL
ncbi:MAG: WYL domain-containing protein [Chloroflexi bacterium]|nr:WYL domain-containing protein [Chloroflexota bacterium]